MYIGNAVDITQIISGYFLNGGSKDLVVDGSITPVIFSVPIPDDGKDYAMTSLNIALNSNTAMDGGVKFMDLPALANGITYGFRKRSDQSLIPVRGPIQNNMDIFSRDAHAGKFDMSSNDDVVSFDVAAGFAVVGNASMVDQVFIAINDDLTDLITGEAYLKMYRVIPQRR